MARNQSGCPVLDYQFCTGADGPFHVEDQVSEMTDIIQRDGLRVVVGLGKTGLSCVRFLRSKGYPVAVNDTRNDPPGLAELKEKYPEVSFSLGRLDESLLMSAVEIICSPGVSIKEPELLAARVNGGIPVVGDVELFAREVSVPVIAITGSNAKSTVTTLVGEMAVSAGLNPGVGGNLGLPVLDMLQEGGKDIYVLELSSFQLETTSSLAPLVATVLNISEDHMDRYTSMVEYHQAKHRIFRNCKHCVVNRDDALTSPLVPESVSVTSFGLSRPDIKDFGVVEENGERFLARGSQKLMAVSDLKIFGDHNVANALAAIAIGEAAGFSVPAMTDTLREFSGLKHRCQLVLNERGVSWYNDSKGTNVGATLAAVSGLGSAIKGRLLLIAGGVGKGQDFSPLSSPLVACGKALILIGEDGRKIGAAVDSAVEHHYSVSLRDAVELAKSLASPGDAVLLSPACASFDMFKNYEDRGDQFVALVREICSRH